MQAVSTSRPLLVLDLDETLWHGIDDPTQPTGVRFLLRPHLRTFLETVGQHYDLAVWTAATEDWMHAGLTAIREAAEFDLAERAFFLWHRERCTWKRTEDGAYAFRKPARKFNAGWIRSKYPRHRVLVVDDVASNYACGYGHLVKVSPWTGDEMDTELEALTYYLTSIARHEDVRSLEKRGWRTRAATFS
ncbi:HAD family hydrolase [Deinococcus yavapaiensis]|uniref:RNA polymerase II subunit A small phosphatase-like protein/ubiquitin-like domain-containing CTD phosphatase 1 n=1 Tax=Deinococcus yavapaiensis KR-236 TaxID=694435 RepID=A0A318S623_9DEIO|nr:HAD family hydrolase [Deinococcus yavapaiensis]PYE49463.1 RNA polymerase II subunit A small phosphatase-like protein/ubiquitin-like domain-containing CTD phosphatase 1 [Deinococcus yavapaiensis KR-236]